MEGSGCEVVVSPCKCVAGEGETADALLNGAFKVFSHVEDGAPAAFVVVDEKLNGGEVVIALHVGSYHLVKDLHGVEKSRAIDRTNVITNAGQLDRQVVIEILDVGSMLIKDRAVTFESGISVEGGVVELGGVADDEKILSVPRKGNTHVSFTMLELRVDGLRVNVENNVTEGRAHSSVHSARVDTLNEVIVDAAIVT